MQKQNRGSALLSAAEPLLVSAPRSFLGNAGTVTFDAASNFVLLKAKLRHALDACLLCRVRVLPGPLVKSNSIMACVAQFVLKLYTTSDGHCDRSLLAFVVALSK